MQIFHFPNSFPLLNPLYLSGKTGKSQLATPCPTLRSRVELPSGDRSKKTVLQLKHGTTGMLSWYSCPMLKQGDGNQSPLIFKMRIAQNEDRPISQEY